MKGIVITGASSGLGASLARAYAEPGVCLGLVARNPERLAVTAASCRERGAEVIELVADVAQSAAMSDWLLEFDTQHPIELLVANAGTSAGPARGEPSEGLERASLQIRTNLLGVVNTLEPVIGRMAARGRGRIGVVASVAGFRGLPDSPAYSASKAGIRIYGEALRPRLRRYGISVTVICPGFFDTPMTDRFVGSKPFLRSLDATTAVVKDALDRRRRRISFPWPLVLGLRFIDLIPAPLGDVLVKAMRFHIASE
jgi:short-subunit dehydrogenase